MLTFRQDGHLTIAHYTDLHIGYPNGEADTRTLADFKKSLLTLEADLIILTGDQVWCYGDFEPAPGYQQIIDLLNLVEIPVIVTYGNHDSEHGKISREELRAMEKGIKHRLAPTKSIITRERLSEYYEIYDQKQEKVIKQLVVFDSGDYVTDEETAKLSEGERNYAYLYPEQIDWFEDTVTDTDDELLVFLHIPLAEYHQAKNFITSGVQGELSTPSVINSGFFARLVTKKNTCAVFAAHDHDNTFTSSYLGVQLNYGLISGYNVYGPEKRGYRQINLYLDQPFETQLVYYD